MDAALKPKISSAGYRPDPVTTEIVRNGLIAATEEMKTNLMRTAYNMIIYEALDFTVGLFDAQGNTVSIGLGLPMFIRGMSDTVKAKLDHYGVENMDPGIMRASQKSPTPWGRPASIRSNGASFQFAPLAPLMRALVHQCSQCFSCSLSVAMHSLSLHVRNLGPWAG